MNNFRRFAIQFATGFMVALILAIMSTFLSNKVQSLDNTLRDYMFILRGPIEPSGNVVIVDIDERSLKEFGQWPWQRYKVAQILQNLTDAGAGIIGLDIVFAEYDNSNPAKVLKELGMPTDNVQDFDEIFAQTVGTTPTIVGYVFRLEKEDDNAIFDKEAPLLPASFIERNKGSTTGIFEAYSVIVNTDEIQDIAFSSGFFNTVPDLDGIIRNVPLVIRHKNELFPSLAMEMMRASRGESIVNVNYSTIEGNGVENIQLGELFIPTDRDARLFVNFRGPSRTFKYISATDIINNNFDPKDVEGKYILLGTSAAGLYDLRATPFESVYPGVEVHANVIDNILEGDLIARKFGSFAFDIALLFLVGITLSVIIGFQSAWASMVTLIIYMASLIGFNYYMLFYEYEVHNILFNVLTLPVFVYMLSLMINYFLEGREKNLIKGKFASKVSPAVMEDLLKHADTDALSGTEREITVFFSDVRNFTNISEAIGNAPDLIDFMNTYMDPMTDIVIEEKGTVDKFIGDAIMAYWNAPSNVPDHADRALIATLRQIHALKQLNLDIRKIDKFSRVVEMSDKNGVEPIEIGIGLNTGVAIVGEMGSSNRSDYTCIGDPINLGARLESLCKYYNSKCNISNFTKERLTGDYIYRFIDLVTVKGKSVPIEIWQVHDFEKLDEGVTPLYAPATYDELKHELELYHKAIALYKEALFSEALEIFKDIQTWEHKTNKNIYNMYIERCEHYIEVPPVDFNGVFVHTTKG
jgi:adenylate cyclase